MSIEPTIQKFSEDMIVKTYANGGQEVVINGKTAAIKYAMGDTICFNEEGHVIFIHTHDGLYLDYETTKN